MIEVKIIGAEERQRALREMAIYLQKIDVPNRMLAAQLYRETMHNFDAEGNDGHPWAPLAPSTIRARERRMENIERARGKAMSDRAKKRSLQRSVAGIYSASPRILQDSGALRQSFMPFSDDRSAGVGAQSGRKVQPGSKGMDAADLAVIHEYGTDHIPARPMLPPREKGLRIAVEVFKAYIERAIRMGKA